MIAEPYICTRGPEIGQIHWLRPATTPSELDTGMWQPYADFEREICAKLECYPNHIRQTTLGYHIMFTRSLQGKKQAFYNSHELLDYSAVDYSMDTESGRLLKRAEFLKAVCEKEGVEWLPKQPYATGGVVSAPAPGEEPIPAALNGCCAHCTGAPRGCLNPCPPPPAPTSPQWCKGREGEGHTCRIGDLTGTCIVCGHVDNPGAREYYTKAEIDAKVDALLKYGELLQDWIEKNDERQDRLRNLLSRTFKVAIENMKQK